MADKKSLNAKNYSVDYNIIKNAIVKSARKNDKVSRDLAFTVDPGRLDFLLGSQNITVIRKSLESRPVGTVAIPLLSEYFIKQRLAWFNNEKEYTTYIFVRNDADMPQEAKDRLLEILHLLNDEEEKEEDVDDVALLAELVAYYPCYFATTVSYISNDPQTNGRMSYSIVCRANKVTIAGERYKYNPQDMS